MAFWVEVLRFRVEGILGLGSVFPVCWLGMYVCGSKLRALRGFHPCTLGILNPPTHTLSHPNISKNWTKDHCNSTERSHALGLSPRARRSRPARWGGGGGLGASSQAGPEENGTRTPERAAYSGLKRRGLFRSILPPKPIYRRHGLRNPNPLNLQKPCDPY